MDRDELMERIRTELQGAFFGGGFGAALMEASDLDSLTDEELIALAIRLGILE